MPDQTPEETPLNQTLDAEGICGNGILSLNTVNETSSGKSQDAPIADVPATDGERATDNIISISNSTSFEDKIETSSVSLSCLANLIHTTSSTTRNDSSNGRIKSELHNSRDRDIDQPKELSEELLSKQQPSVSGGVLVKLPRGYGTTRGMNIQTPSQHTTPRSPSQKKHKCPYCETEFTRHHNLKSHLLTHSQEKPYICQTCSMRFRRLHDLKRHTKLHTGERPHICSKCDRKFARGDALARHLKGQGGCAGRRVSNGSFGGDDDPEDPNTLDKDDTAMDGVIYGNGISQNIDHGLNEEERRRFSLPSIQAKHIASSDREIYVSSSVQNSHPSAGSRPGQSTGGLLPPPGDRNSSVNSANSPHMKDVLSEYTSRVNLSNLPLNAGGTSMFPPSVMIEGSKPSSPASVQSSSTVHDTQSVKRQNSPSLTSQFQPHSLGRQQSTQGSSPGIMPISSPNHSKVPNLPALASLAPSDQRCSLSSQAPIQLSPGNELKSKLISSSLNSSTVVQNSTTQQNLGSIDLNSSNIFANGEKEVWTYVQTLEDRVKQLSDKMQVMETKEKSQEDKINKLSLEVISLKNQLNVSNQSLHLTASGHS